MLANSNMKNAQSIQTLLEASIGHPGKRMIAKSKMCGIPSLPGCKKQWFCVEMVVTEGIVKKMIHQYYWQASIIHFADPPINQTVFYLWGCPLCGKNGYDYPINYVHAFATTTSTVEGSDYGDAIVECRTPGVYDCP